MNIQKLIKWLEEHELLILIILVSVSFMAGVSFESNSVAHAFEGIIYPEYDCYHKANEISSYTNIPFTKGLKNMDCNEIDWLYEKIQKYRRW